MEKNEILNTIKILCLDYSSNFNLPCLEYYANFMPRYRLEQFNRYSSLNKKISCVLSYLLIGFFLKKYHNYCAAAKFCYNENGKPFLINKNIFFNISHVKNVIVAAFSKQEVGVDVEKIRPIKNARKILTEDELKKFATSKNKEQFFFYAWTRKESFCKLEGSSIFSSFKKINSLSLKNTKTFKFGNFVLSISSHHDFKPLFEKVSLNKILK